MNQQMTDAQHAEIFKRAGEVVQQWALELADGLDPESAGRLMLAGAVPILERVYGKSGAGELSAGLADELDRELLN